MLTKWVIDVPRMGEEPAPEADLFIYPTREDAEQKTPAGKRYTWDLAVIAARPDELRNAVKLKEDARDEGSGSMTKEELDLEAEKMSWDDQNWLFNRLMDRL